MDVWDVGFLCLIVYFLTCVARDIAMMVRWLWIAKIEKHKATIVPSKASQSPATTNVKTDSLPLQKDLHRVYVIPGPRNKALNDDPKLFLWLFPLYT